MVGRSVAALPAVTVGHFGPELRRFVLELSITPGQVTVPRIVAQLRDLGMAISKRQVVRLLIAGKEDFVLAPKSSGHAQRSFLRVPL